VEWALDVPMYFVMRDGRYHDATHVTFRQMLDGALRGQVPDPEPNMGDWANHLSTVFPDVRLKRFLEMRGADVGGPAMIAAQSAFWVGLLYEPAALDAAWDLVKDWTAADREAARATAPRLGLATSLDGRSLGAVAAEALAIARGGLLARARRDAAGRDETGYLQPLEAIVAAGRTRAEALLSEYDGPWGKSVDPAFEACLF